MAVELKVPAVGESITEVQIGEWFKTEGDQAEKDENLVEIETDKATVEVPAPISGTISKVLKQRGETAVVGEVIAYMEEIAAAPSKASPKKGADSKQKSDGQQAAKESGPKKAQVEQDAPAAKSAARAVKADAERTEQPARATNNGPEAASQPPARGHLTVSRPTVESEEPTRLAEGLFRSKRQLEERPRDTKERGGKLAPTSNLAMRSEEIVPMSPIRKKIAQRLVQAQQNAALLTTFNEIDMSAVISLRKEHK